MATPESVHLRDTRANQPAAAVGNAGVIFCVTDEGDILERSNGTTWESFSPPSVDESNVNITGGSITGITDLAIADGGTGASTATAAFDNLSPTTTAGDLIYSDGTNNVRLGIGTAGQVLTVNAGATAPEWAAPTGGGGALDDLTDVDAPSPSDGDVLTFDSGSGDWIASAPTGGGGGIDTTTAAHASRPAAGNAGDLFLPNDGFYIERDTGAAWAPWGPIWPITPPDDGSFTWVNQASGTSTTTRGGIILTRPAASGDNVTGKFKSAAATPWTVTALVVVSAVQAAFQSAGLAYRQSSDGKIVTCGLITTGGLFSLVSSKWNSATSFSADYGGVTAYAGSIGHLVWLRIGDDGTNRNFYVSTDGHTFYLVHTVGRTDFLTADQVGFFVSVNNASNAPTLTLLSWKQT